MTIQATRNVFLIGATKTGKTTLARRLAEDLGLTHVSASAWLRGRPDVPAPVADDAPMRERVAFTEAITRRARAELSRDPDVCVDFLRQAHPSLDDGGFVVEGIRNPRDFLLLFRPERDLVLYLDFAANPHPPTTFERDGIAVIHALTTWLVLQGVTPSDRVHGFRIDAVRGQSGPCGDRHRIPGPAASAPCWDIDELLIYASVWVEARLEGGGAPKKRLVSPEQAERIARVLVTLEKEDDPRWIANVVMIAGYRVVAVQLKTDAEERAQTAREAIVRALVGSDVIPFRQLVHAPLDVPLYGWVENRVLQDDDPAVEGWSPAQVFALSSYAGHALTVQIRLANGAVFSYVPLHRVRFSDPAAGAIVDRLDLRELVYHDCPDERIAVTTYPHLRGAVRAYIAARKTWRTGTYLATVDWYTGNDLLHLVMLANGQLAALPSHKVLFAPPADVDALPAYKKLHAEWRVDEGAERLRAFVASLGDVVIPDVTLTAEDYAAFSMADPNDAPSEDPLPPNAPEGKDPT